MAIVRKRLTMYEGDSLPKSVIREVEEADKYPIVFDEDCPELSDAQLEKMTAIVRERDAKRERKTLSLDVLPSTVRAAEKYGHCDVEVTRGGQPVYYCIIAVE